MALAALLALAAGCRAEQRTTAPAAETPVRQGRARVLHERDFVGSPDLRLRPEDTAVFRLEGGAHPHPDTATAGIDLVPMRFERPASHAFCVGESGPASVEVLAPASLRDDVAATHARAAARYGSGTAPGAKT
jgi:hypothetical protein